MTQPRCYTEVLAALQGVTPALPISCERLRPGCTTEIEASPGVSSGVLTGPRRYAIVRGHRGSAEAVVGDAGDASFVEARTEG